MYTGIVQGAFEAVEVERKPEFMSFAVRFPAALLEDLASGSSVNVDGVCQTVVRVDGDRVWFDAMVETLRRTTLGQLRQGDQVNIERSARVGQENGGHERMHRDIQVEIQRSPCADRRSQQEAIDEWCYVFNYERPHEAIDMKTPAELYRCSRRKYRAERPAMTYPAHFEVRRVLPNGSIKYKQRSRFISESLAAWDIGIEHTSAQLRIWFSTMLLGTTDLDFDGPVDPAA